MADFSITGEVRLNSEPAEKSTSKWTIAAGNMIADFAKKAAGALAQVVKSGVEYNSTMEDYLTNFRVMLGSEEQAAAQLEQLRKMAAATPFGLGELADGTQTLLQFQVAAEDVSGVLQRLGDLSLGDAGKLQTLTRAYGKMNSAQKVSLENVNMMIDAGFNPLNQICDATGETMTELYGRISEGKVSFGELDAAIVTATSEGGQFYNGMAEASQTLTGRTATLKDNITALVGEMTQGLFEALGEGVSLTNDVVSGVLDDEEKLRTLKETLAGVTAAIAAGTAAFAAYKAQLTLHTLIAAVTKSLNGMSVAQYTAAAAQKLLNGTLLANPLGAVVTVVAAFAAGLVTAYQTSEVFRTRVDAAFAWVKNAADTALGTVNDWLNETLAKLTGAAAYIANLKNGFGEARAAFDKAYDDAVNEYASAKLEKEQEKERQRRKALHDERVQQAQQEAAALRAAAADSTHALEQAAETAGQENAAVAVSVQKAAAAVVESVTDTSTEVDGRVTRTTETVTEILADGTEQQKQVITETGTEIIDGVERTVRTVTTVAADGTRTVAKTIEDAGPQFGSAGEQLAYQLRCALEDGWEEINTGIRNDALGSIRTLAEAVSSGDVEQLAKWTVATFWAAATTEQKAQINAFAIAALDKLTASFQTAGSGLVQLAASLVGQFVPAAGAATTAQQLLNTVMDANPILLVVSLIGLLVGALARFSSANEEAAGTTRSVWSGIGDFLSLIFEGVLRLLGSFVQGFVNLINGLIWVYNKVAWLWDGGLDYISNPVLDYADKLAQARKDREEARKNDQLKDALEANTAALAEANKQLADMVRQANALVLHDNRALGARVAASGSAQVAAAANQYHTATTSITQNIYSKAQTAADLARETRWEADRARAQRH